VDYPRYGDQPVADVLRKTFILLLGTIIILFGIIMLPLPGPGIIIILAGLGIIGAEFPPVRRWTARKWAEIRKKTPLG
jgi:uncharacterized protein (TIGR02611 family)